MTLRFSPALLSAGAALAFACAPKGPTPDELAVSAMSPPILPAPEAPLYATGSAAPRDPLVARAVEWSLLPWQESLSGAATTLVLESEGGLDLNSARHAAWRAGYPYPVVRIIAGDEEPGTFPQGLLEAIQRQVKPADHIGLVRARKASRDHWIALVGRPAGVLESIPRQVRTGDEVAVTLDRPGAWVTVTPDGALARGRTPVELTLDIAGEWWLQVETVDGRLISGVPISVGVEPAAGPTLPIPGPSPSGPSETRAEAVALVNDLREAFDLTLVEHDGTLDTLAERPLEQVVAGTWDRAAGEERLRGAGFVGGPVVQVRCAAPTVEMCIDDLFATAEGRAAVLHPQVRVGGAAAQVTTRGVVVVVNLASE